MAFFAALLALVFAASIAAQEENSPEASLDWDIDTIFDQPSDEIPGEEKTEGITQVSSAPVNLMSRRGYTFNASFRFVAGFLPGWDQAPWHFDGDQHYSTNPSVRMRSTFSINAQISEVLSVKTSLYFTIPSFAIRLDDFFFDYSLYETVFLRGGKFGLSWGISRNYNFANLISRIPDKKYNRAPFLLKADIPFGIGGFQFVTLTRANLMGGRTPAREDFAYGGKYNLAHPLFDADIGIFYQEGMDLRSFMSIKTTLWDFELYNEYLGAFDIEGNSGFSGAVNLGIAREFFDRKFSVNAEIFYNAERNAMWFSPETDLKDSEIFSFLEGFNLALNLLYRVGGKGNPRLFVQTLYAIEQDSARLIPGFRLSPWQHVDLYFAVPMSLGSKEGYYYLHNEDPRNRPFSVVLLATIRGSVRSAHYQ